MSTINFILPFNMILQDELFINACDLKKYIQTELESIFDEGFHIAVNVEESSGGNLYFTISVISEDGQQLFTEGAYIQEDGYLVLDYIKHHKSTLEIKGGEL